MNFSKVSAQCQCGQFDTFENAIIMENESILVSVFPLAFTVVDHFTTLPLPTMGLVYST